MAILSIYTIMDPFFLIQSLRRKFSKCMVSNIWTGQKLIPFVLFYRTSLVINYSMKKGRYLTQSYNNSPYTNSKNPKSNVTTQKATINIDYTTIADRIRTASWSNNTVSPTGVVSYIKQYYECNYDLLNLPTASSPVCTFITGYCFIIGYFVFHPLFHGVFDLENWWQQWYMKNIVTFLK